MNQRQIFLVALASYLYSLSSLGQLLKWMVFLSAWYFTGGARWLYLFRHTAKRDFRLMFRGIGFIKTMAYAKYFNKNVIYNFRKCVKTFSTKTMFINATTDETWSYDEMEKYSNRVANFFMKEGFRKGDSIALVMENRPEYVAFLLGLAKVGIVPALINTNLRKDGLIHTITAADSKAILYGLEMEEAIMEVYDQLLDKNQNKFPSYVSKIGSGLPKDVSTKLKSSKDLDAVVPTMSAEPEPESVTKSISTFDIFFYIYTSGTTGLPKAVPIKHIRQVFVMSGIYKIISLRADDRIYCYLPLYHSSGIQIGVGPSMFDGSTTVIKKKFSASSFWKDCIKYNVTASQYIGEIARYLLATKESPEEKQHKVRIMYGNGLRPQVWTTFTERFNIASIAEFYGATEGNSSIVNLENIPGKVGFIGVCFPDFIQDKLLPLQVIKVDQETGEPLRNSEGFCIKTEPGEPGEFVGKIVKGDPVKEFTGYRDREATKKKILINVFKKGDCYFRSGDILIRDEFGWLSFKDRKGDTFRWKGENVSTQEVEATISNIMGLKDATSYGVEVPNMDGRASMVSIPSKDSSDLDLEKLYDGVQQKLPSYARPIFVRLASEVHLTGTYKLKKNVLQKEGFDLAKVKDPIFFLDARAKKYVKLTEDIFQDIMNGKIRL